MKKSFVIPFGIILSLLISSHVSAAEIHQAAKSGDLGRVRKLIGKDSSLADAKDERGWTALLYATFMGHGQVVKFLLENGADVNAQSNRGWAALHQAALSGHPGVEGVAKILLDHGADANLLNQDGDSPLYVALRHKHFKTARMLIKRGGDPNTPGSMGPPLHCAVFIGHSDVVKFLLNNGADVNVRNENGNTPLAVAEKLGKSEIAKILRKAGGTK